MSHQPITITNLSLDFPHKVCFEGFNTQILPGDRIGIIGRNGSGKSSLVKMLMGQMDPSGGKITGIDDLTVGYVPQTVLEHTELSGGERFNKAFTEAIATQPDLLILDEPTNHLDQNVKYSLLRKLDGYNGTLIIVSHDLDVLTHTVDKLWHIKDGKIVVFSGDYDDYMYENGLALASQQKILNDLKKEKKKLKIQRQQESQKAGKAGKKKAKDNDKLGFDAKSDNAQAKADAKIAKLNERLGNVQSSLQQNRLPEEYKLKFNIGNAYVQSGANLVSVSFGECSYGAHIILSDVFFSMAPMDKVSISGNNASGKTTFIKAIMQNKSVNVSGDWFLPKPSDIGYLEQHYTNLNPDDTVEGVIQKHAPSMDAKAIRKHLNDFLFRKNEEVFAKVKTLSGGEKARLSLAQIAARPPKLLILDEITNNIDLETKEYIISVLNAYAGAFIIVSHENGFLDRLNLTNRYFIQNGSLKQKFR